MRWNTGNARQTAKQPGFEVDEKVVSLFQPDTLLAAQYFATLHRNTVVEPERRLMLAILEEAINSFKDNVLAQGGRGKKLFREAQEWILETGDDWVFSFENICEALGLNPAYVRQGVMRWKEKKLAGRPDVRIRGDIALFG